MDISNKTVLITGGTGSFGKTMLNFLLQEDVGQVKVFSRDEDKQDTLRNKLKDDRVEFQIGDVRDKDSVNRAVRGVDYVFHAAALKQVPSCEFFPMQAVMTNVAGSENVIRSSVDAGVKSVVCLSTDKAVFPVNAMGMSKAMMEKVAYAAARELGPNASTTVSCVPYGNVLCSRGSVVPLLVDQVKTGRPMTVTVPEMTRFLMPLSESVALVKFAFEHARQGDLFIRKAAAATIADLVQAVKNCLNAPEHSVKIIGWRHGEKMYETLASAMELSTAEDMGDYWRLQSDLRGLNYKKYFSEGDVQTVHTDEFNSHNTAQMSASEIENLLLSLPEFMSQAFNKNDDNASI